MGFDAGAWTPDSRVSTLCHAELTCKYTLSGSICFTKNTANSFYTFSEMLFLAR
jgi:hypothetical protein